MSDKTHFEYNNCNTSEILLVTLKDNVNPWIGHRFKFCLYIMFYYYNFIKGGVYYVIIFHIDKGLLVCC